MHTYENVEGQSAMKRLTCNVFQNRLVLFHGAMWTEVRTTSLGGSLDEPSRWFLLPAPGLLLDQGSALDLTRLAAWQCNTSLAKPNSASSTYPGPLAGVSV